MKFTCFAAVTLQSALPELVTPILTPRNSDLGSFTTNLKLNPFLVFGHFSMNGTH